MEEHRVSGRSIQTLLTGDRRSLSPLELDLPEGGRVFVGNINRPGVIATLQPSLASNQSSLASLSMIPRRVHLSGFTPHTTLMQCIDLVVRYLDCQYINPASLPCDHKCFCWASGPQASLLGLFLSARTPSRVSVPHSRFHTQTRSSAPPLPATSPLPVRRLRKNGRKRICISSTCTPCVQNVDGIALQGYYGARQVYSGPSDGRYVRFATSRTKNLRITHLLMTG